MYIVIDFCNDTLRVKWADKKCKYRTGKEPHPYLADIDVQVEVVCIEDVLSRGFT